MSQIALPALYALLIWWLSTGIILYLIGLNRRTYPVTLVSSAIVLAAALGMMAADKRADSVWDAYVAFTGALAVWGFVEVTFLTGTITGPRKTSCPAGSQGWSRARFATETIIYHEFALVAAGMAVVAATWGGENWVAPATFALLWLLRLSSKLNLFLGVPMLNDELLPDHLRYLASYFARRKMNALFPFSVIASTAGVIFLLNRAAMDGTSAFDVAAYSLIAALLALALLEHFFMMLPVSVGGLWGKRSKIKDGTAGEDSVRTDRLRSDAPHTVSRPIQARIPDPQVALATSSSRQPFRSFGDH